MFSNTLIKVRGFCPQGCGETLFVGAGGYITCSNSKCRLPDAVSKLLEDSESHHIVDFVPDEHTAFVVTHPLRERINNELLRCELHEYVSKMPRETLRPGRYRAVKMIEGWMWQRLPGAEQS